MVNITISLPEETVRRMKRVVKERYGGRRGALSGLVREAVEERIDWLEAPRPKIHFKASKDGRTVAEADGIGELASKLRALDIDPRTVLISSSSPLRQVARAGLRGGRK
jgi:Arc/MetJ-type ribon-helix-helix transcriptional regulator